MAGKIVSVTVHRTHFGPPGEAVCGVRRPEVLTETDGRTLGWSSLYTEDLNIVNCKRCLRRLPKERARRGLD